MSLDIWPPISPADLKVAQQESEMLIDTRTGRKRHELEWMITELRETMRDIKHGLEDCYALLAPVEPGSTLVMSTPRNEKVKGHITRVGTRIVKGTINLQLRTIPVQTITINPACNIHIAPLEAIHTHLTQCIDMLSLTLGEPLSAGTISAQLRVLANALAECTALLKGPPLTESDPTWTDDSCAASHFSPPLGSNISFHLSIQESSLVLWLRALEPADAPVHFGMKLGLAIGTVRRLEHDEMDRVFDYCCSDAEPSSRPGSARGTPRPEEQRKEKMPVFVREKVRVESADPSLMSIAAKLMALGHTLAQARRNLAAVIGEELEE